MLKWLANPTWAILEYGWYPLLLFATTPWFLRCLDTERYGYWMLLTATVSFGGALNVGTSAATIKSVSSGRGSSDDAQALVRASIAIAAIGGGVLALVVLLVYWGAGGALLGRMGSDPQFLHITGLAAALMIWLEQLDCVASSVLKGVEQFGRAARIEILSKTIQIGIAAVAVGQWPSLTALYTALLATGGIRLFAKLWVLRRALGIADLRPSFQTSTSILRLARWGWLQGVGGVLFGVADRLLVGTLLGATSLAYYSIATQLSMQIHAVTAAGLSVVFPAVSRRLQEQGSFSLRPLARLVVISNILLSSILAFLVATVGPFIVSAWVGGEAAATVRELIPSLTAAYWVLALVVAPYYILLGMGRMRFVGLTALCAGMLGIVVMAFAIANWGLLAAPAGRGAYAVASLLLYFPVAARLANEQRGDNSALVVANADIEREIVP
jgi:O-antigen/teichoic acid export membrane protein